MGPLRRWAFGSLLLGAVAVGLAVSFREALVVAALGWVASVPALGDATDEGPSVRWVDDYFAVRELDAHTFAILEPRYWQQNVSYLIAGRERALLFDAGPGVRDIRPIAKALVSVPITFVPSHFHFDHTGNRIAFERVAVVDLPELRERADGNRLRLLDREHLGLSEKIEAPTLEIDEWWPPGTVVDLGGRSLRVLHTPGHSPESISLLDLASGDLFSGDFLYEGSLFAFLPGGSLGEYAMGAHTVDEAIDANARIFGAHRIGPPGVPVLAGSDIRDLRRALGRIRDGELTGRGAYPVVYPVNDRIELLAEPRWLQDWNAAPPR